MLVSLSSVLILGNRDIETTIRTNYIIHCKLGEDQGATGRARDYLIAALIEDPCMKMDTGAHAQHLLGLKGIVCAIAEADT